MNSPPVIVHAAADLRREALLAESERDRRSTPPRALARAFGVRTMVHSMADWTAAAVSRIVDDFEPSPHPADPTAATGQRWALRQPAGSRRISQT
jgi:hypothetical protein